MEKTLKQNISSDIYSFLRNSGNQQKKPKFIAEESRFSQALHVTDFSSPSNDVFHIKNKSRWLSDMVLPIVIEEEIKNIIFEQSDKDFFVDIGLPPTNKILFYWEPWCWKTMLTYIISSMLWRELKVVNLSKLISAHLGETSNNIANIFSKYWSKDYVLFIDEFDIIGRLRWDSNNDHNEMKRIVNALLQLIDFIPNDAFLVFATNSLDIVDKALLRRLDRVIEIPLPELWAIRKFLKMRLSKYIEFTESLNYSLIAKHYLWKSFSDIQRELDKIIKSFIVKNRKEGKEIKITTSDLIKS